jgi:4-hydroxy-tetrahydrodipicolinate synthase
VRLPLVEPDERELAPVLADLAEAGWDLDALGGREGVRA